jgi:hypothetical protein
MRVAADRIFAHFQAFKRARRAVDSATSSDGGPS